ncbi:MAG: ABC transporter permease subunit, partial [Spirochaetia bacterium]
SMTILVIQRVYLQRKSFASSGTRSPEPINPRPVKKLLLTLLFAVVLLFSLLPIITIVISSFTAAIGPVLQYGTFTLDHYRNTFYAVLRPLRNSYILATVSMILDVILGSLIGYVIVRKGKRLATFLDAFVALPLGIPGVLLGIGLILGFSQSPLVLVGTASILMVAYFVRRLPHPVRTVSAILAQVDPNLEEASVNLGVPPVRTFLKVTSRMIRPGIVSGGLLAWTSSVADLTCTILIYPARWKTLTVETYAQIRSDLYGPASVVGIFLLLSVIVPILVVNVLLLKKRRPGAQS